MPSDDQPHSAASGHHSSNEPAHADGAHGHGLLQPIVWPFQRGEWKRTWWLLLADYIPVVNLLLLRGWRLALVGRMARGEQPKAPPLTPSKVLEYLANGLLLWGMTALYALVPLVVIAKLGLGGMGDLMRDVLEVFRILLGRSEQSLWTFATNELLDSIAAAAIELAWIPLSAPLYRAAMIRYAVTGNIAAFLNLPATVTFLFQNAGAFFKNYVFSFVMAVVVLLLGLGLAATVVGAVLMPIVTFPLYYWSTGFEYGELAHTLAERRRRRGAVAVPPSTRRQIGGAAVALAAVGIMAVRSLVLQAMAVGDGAVALATEAGFIQEDGDPAAGTVQYAGLGLAAGSPGRERADTTVVTRTTLTRFHAALTARSPDVSGFLAPRVDRFLGLRDVSAAAVSRYVQSELPSECESFTAKLDLATVASKGQNAVEYVEHVACTASGSRTTDVSRRMRLAFDDQGRIRFLARVD